MTEELDALGMPVPAPEALDLSRRLAAHMEEAIGRAGGAIRFSDFMDMALYAPGLGYYSAGARKFGPPGDFVTAPEVSSLFPRCLARACTEILASVDGGEILEIGGGSGVMAAEILASLASMNRLPRKYLMLEISADLRDRQRALVSGRVPELAETIHWVDDIPARFRGVILANEVLDALPFERFRMYPDGPVYLGVACGREGFRSVPLAEDEALIRHVRLIDRALGQPLPRGYESEWCPRLPAFVSTVASGLEAGVALFVDYGLPRRQLYHPQRSAGTMMCHYRHRAHSDPFFYPGLQDITAWVDFTSVAEAATSAGMILEGFTTQAHFLLGSGLGEVAGLAGRTPREGVEIAAQMRKLTLPGEMGERFKVMALSRDWHGELSGLTRRDLSGSL